MDQDFFVNPALMAKAVALIVFVETVYLELQAKFVQGEFYKFLTM